MNYACVRYNNSLPIIVSRLTILVNRYIRIHYLLQQQLSAFHFVKTIPIEKQMIRWNSAEAEPPFFKS